jgi:hypothetical protein
VFGDDLGGTFRDTLYVAFVSSVLLVGMAGSLAIRRLQRR